MREFYRDWDDPVQGHYVTIAYNKPLAACGAIDHRTHVQFRHVTHIRDTEGNPRTRGIAPSSSALTMPMEPE
jgi:hypothetical protein